MSKASLVAALEGSDNDLDTYLELSNTSEIRADIRALAASPDVTLRDNFAAAALQGWLANGPRNEAEKRPVDSRDAGAMAQLSYSYADAMLKAREQ